MPCPSPSLPLVPLDPVTGIAAILTGHHHILHASLCVCVCVYTSQYISGEIIYGSCCVNARELSSSSSSLSSETLNMKFVLKTFPSFHQSPVTEPNQTITKMQLAIVHGSGDLARIVVSVQPHLLSVPWRRRKCQTLKQTVSKPMKTTHSRRNCQCHVGSPPCPHFKFISPCQVAR